MYDSSDLFDEVLYMFRTGPLFIIRSIATLNCILAKGICHVSSVAVCQLVRIFLPDHASRRQHNQHDKYLLRVYSVEILLMMDSRPVQNTQSTLSNKFQKLCILLAFIIRIYHEARSSEYQIQRKNFIIYFEIV